MVKFKKVQITASFNDKINRIALYKRELKFVDKTGLYELAKHCVNRLVSCGKIILPKSGKTLKSFDLSVLN